MTKYLDNAVEAISGKRVRRAKKSKMAIYHTGTPSIGSEKGMVELMKRSPPPLPDKFYAYKDGKKVALYKDFKMAIHQDVQGDTHIFTGADVEKVFKFENTKRGRKGLVIKDLR